jgi:hypothetical protein
MTKNLMAMVLSASLALTSITATPARADEDVGKVLAGIAALVILGAAANKQKHRNENKRASRHVPVETWAPAPKLRKQVKRAPQRCLRDQWTHRGNRQVYGARCMNRHSNAQLPNRCLRQADVNQGPRRFYTKRCLRKNGWRA